MSLDNNTRPGAGHRRWVAGLCAVGAASLAAALVVVATYAVSPLAQRGAGDGAAPAGAPPRIVAQGPAFAAAQAAPAIGRLLTSVQAVDPDDGPPPAMPSLTAAINDPVPDRHREVQPSLSVDPVPTLPRPPDVAAPKDPAMIGRPGSPSSAMGGAGGALSAMPTRSLAAAVEHDAVLALWHPPEVVASPWLEWALRTSVPGPVVPGPVPRSIPSIGGLAEAPVFPDGAWQETVSGTTEPAAAIEVPADAIAESAVTAAPAMPGPRPAPVAAGEPTLTDIEPSAGRFGDDVREVYAATALAPARIGWPALANAPSAPSPVDATAFDIAVPTADPSAPLDAEPSPQDLTAAPVDPPPPAELLDGTVPVGDGLDILSAEDWVDPSTPWPLDEAVFASPYAALAEPLWPDITEPTAPPPAAAEVRVIRAAAPRDDDAHRLAVAAPLTNLAVIDEAHGVRVLGPRRSDADRQGYADARLPGCTPGDHGCATFVGAGRGRADAPLLTAEMVAEATLGLGQWNLPDDPFEAERALRCMVFAAYSEAGNQGALGMAAVVWVVVNRVAEQRFFEDDPCSVIAQPGQFEPMSVRRFRGIATAIRDGALPPFPAPLNRWDAVNIRTARLVVWQLVSGRYVDDPSGGAYFFLAPAVMRARGQPLPGWAAADLRTASIGGHDFFRLPDRYR